MFFSSKYFKIFCEQNPLSALNNFIFLPFNISNVSSKKAIQLFELDVLPLLFQQLATIRNSLIKANKG